MPKKDEVLRELRTQATRYAEKSTELSEMLLEVESFLNDIPAKSETTVIDTECVPTGPDAIGPAALRFVRHQSSNWRLLYHDGFGSDVWVTEASVSAKARSAQLLPELVDLLISTHRSGLEEIEKGLDALRGIPFLDIDEAEVRDA